MRLVLVSVLHASPRAKVKAKANAMGVAVVGLVALALTSSLALTLTSTRALTFDEGNGSSRNVGASFEDRYGSLRNPSGPLRIVM